MDFRKTKFWIVLAIMGSGMLVALLFHSWQGWFAGKGYPYDTLFSESTSFTDFSDIIISSGLPNPYIDPKNDYLPFTYFAFRVPALVPENMAVIVYIFISLGGLSLLLIHALKDVVENPWLRVGSSLLLVALSYPIIFCVDRGNIEILLALCVACCIYFYSRGQYWLGTPWLLPALCSKIFTMLFLILLLRQRKWGLAMIALMATGLITLGIALSLPASLQVIYGQYMRGLQHITEGSIYENAYLEGSASPWVTYKLLLAMAKDAGFISPIDFDWDGPFITTSYAIYSKGIMFLLLLLALYSWFIEKEFHRCAILCLLFVSMAVPTGADYRMVYVAVALALLVPIKNKRPGDLMATVLMAFTLVPKKFFFFNLTDYPASPDISIQVILNPVTTLAAMGFLLYGAYLNYDSKWTKLRMQLFWCSLPWLGKFGLKRASVHRG